MSPHTKGPWRLSEKTTCAVVGDHPVPEISGSEMVDHYGGHLIAESIAPQNRPVIAAAPQLLEAVSYVLDQIQINPDLRYYAGYGTQVFYVLVRAEAAALGVSIEEVEARRREDRQPAYRRREPEVLHLREQLDALRAEVGR